MTNLIYFFKCHQKLIQIEIKSQKLQKSNQIIVDVNLLNIN